MDQVIFCCNCLILLKLGFHGIHEKPIRAWKTRGLKNRQIGKLMETRLNPVDARVGAFVSLCPSFFFLFNNLKKKKKRAAQAVWQGLQTDFVEKAG